VSQKQRKHEFGVGGEIFSISKEGAEYKLNTIKEPEKPRRTRIRRQAGLECRSAYAAAGGF
jgi:hypothetical protein